MISKPRTIKVAFVAALLSLMLLLGASAFAQAPAAGTTIGNQASATYTDGSSVQRTATSNLVVTTVQQVAAFTLTANNAKTATPGAQVVYSQTLTNTGNGPDNFTIGLTAAGAFTHTNIAVYLDANNDGIADNNVNLVGPGTVPLAAGASVHLLVVGTVPVSATSGQTGTMSISASSTFDNTVPAVTDVDTTTVTGNAVVNLTKSLSATSGASPSGPYTVTLTYTNNGNATASNVKIVDNLPAGMNYVANSGRWSVTGATVLTDATGDVQPAAGSPNIDYSIDGTSRIITAIVNSVPAQTSGTLTFQVNIATGLAPGAINNIATIQYNDGTSNVGPFNSNIATFTVNQTPGVSISDTGSSASGDSDNTVNGVQLVANATQGATVTFTNIVKNTGNGTDTFNITLSGSTFPAGTTFVLYKSDGVTPLTDSNADGVADTGPLAANTTYNVIVKATLPSSSSGGGPYNVTATATSVFSSGTTATVTERLTTITANTVDLTNNSPAGTGVPGNGAGPEASAQVTNNVNPGVNTVFTLYVNNTSATADTYDLLVSTSTTFSGNTLPAGWTIAFQNSGNGSDCTSLGSTITNTGVVNAASNKLVCAVIGVPAGYAAGTQQIYFRSLSSTSNAADVLHDAVTVNTVHSVTLTPNNTGQIFPGGSVVYVHTLKNNGNATETVTFSGTWISDNQSLWASTLYTDNGTQANQLDAGDTPVSSGANNSFNLTPGQTMVMLVKVIAPPSAAAGAVDTTTVTATYNGGSSTATANDQSTVIAGDLRLNKLQATSSACNGTPDAAFSAANLSAKPLACVVYQITAQNQGTANVTSVVVSDATPTNTTYFDNSGAFKAATTVGSIANPTSGSAGTITATVGTLTPGQSAVITFMVKIN